MWRLTSAPPFDLEAFAPFSPAQKERTQETYNSSLSAHALLYRIGQGIDFHQLAEGRELWLGGVHIPHAKGCIAHSDGDVLIHALCDALLGALGLGDIGKHFPDTDAAYKNIDSKLLLQKAYTLVQAKGYILVNADTTLLLQAPKIKPYIAQMQEAMSGILGIAPEDVSVKATTTEQLSFIGREEGVVATASVLLRKMNDAE